MSSLFKIYKNIFNKLSLGIIIFNKRNKIIFLNDFFKNMTNYTEKDLREKNDFFKKICVNKNQIKTQLLKNINFEAKREISFRYKDGHCNLFSLKFNKLNDELFFYELKKINKVDYFIESENINYNSTQESKNPNLNEQHKQLKKMRYLSFHDGLTGLYNRRFFNYKLKKCSRKNNLPITILVGDIDNLKLINDNYGHLVGDKYIKRSALILKESLRKEDIIARTGGDEFAVILLRTDKKSANKVLEKIKRAIKKENKKSNLKNNLSISLGAATMENSVQDLVDYYHLADKKMYKNKDNKKKKIS